MAPGSRIKLKRSVRIILGAVVLFSILALIENSINGKKIGYIHVNIENQEGNYFLDSLEIQRLLNSDQDKNLGNLSFRDVSIKSLESKVKANLFVDHCEIARDLNGDLYVDIRLTRPIARFVREKRPDFYIDSSGKIMPVLDRFTARVLLVTREKDSELPQFERKDHNLLVLINAIQRDDFLKAQIAQLHMNRKREVTMYTQVGDQVITFGRCQNIASKLKKLKIFYQEILRLKGWDAYQKVNLKYDNQIICE